MPATDTVRPRRPKPRAAASARSTLTPERWIEEATEVLVDRGIDSVRVDVLAQQLQVVARKEMLLAGPADLASLVSQLFPPSEVVTPARPGPAGF